MDDASDIESHRADVPANQTKHSNPPAAFSHQEVDNILSNTGKSRQRIRKACYPCNKRKIKCDRDERVPCGNCAKRPHPELCSFDDHAPRSMPPRVRQPGHDSSSPRPARSSAFAQTPDQHLLQGVHSASAPYTRQALSNGQSNEHGSWRDSRNGTEGMQASAGPEYNFVRGLGFQTVNGPQSAASGRPETYSSHRTSWDTAPPRSERTTFWDMIGPLLPPQKHLLRFFDTYRTLCNPLYPVISDFDEFEAAVVTYIDDVASFRLRAELEHLQGFALELRLCWLALLSATIASGVQYSGVKPVERRALVENFVKNTMQLLSYANSLFRPNESSVMAYLLVSRILQNDFQPEAAWSMIGMVTRMAESIGLRTPSQDESEDITTREADADRQRKLWWAILWQESQLTMCFGKTASLDAKDSPASNTSTNLTYIECMYSLCQFAIDSQKYSSPDPNRSSFGRSIDAIAFVRELHSRALPRLSDKQKCRSIQDRIEYFAFRIHQGFVVSFLSRLLMKSGLRLDQAQWDSLLQICQSSAIDCVRAYLDMQSFSVVPGRSWTLTFTALSSALVLGSLAATTAAAAATTTADDSSNANTINELQNNLLDVLHSSADEDVEASSPTWPGRYANALAMLSDMCQPKTEDDAKDGHGHGHGHGHATHGPTWLPDVEGQTQAFLDPQRLWQEYFSTNELLAHGGPGQLSVQMAFGF